MQVTRRRKGGGRNGTTGLFATNPRHRGNPYAPTEMHPPCFLHRRGRLRQHVGHGFAALSAAPAHAPSLLLHGHVCHSPLGHSYPYPYLCGAGAIAPHCVHARSAQEQPQLLLGCRGESLRARGTHKAASQTRASYVNAPARQSRITIHADCSPPDGSWLTAAATRPAANLPAFRARAARDESGVLLT